MPRSLKISSKGQIIVPIEIRKRLGAKPGDRVEFVNEEGRQVLQPVRPEESPFTKFIGSLPAFKSMDEINAWIHDMRGHESENL